MGADTAEMGAPSKAQPTAPAPEPHHVKLHDYLIRRLKKHGNKVSQVDSDTGASLTFSDVLLGAETLAAELRARGLRPGHVALVIAENRTHFSWVLLGLLQAGATATLISPRSRKGEIEYAVATTRPHLALLSEEASRGQEIATALCGEDSVVPQVLVWGQDGPLGHVSAIKQPEGDDAAVVPVQEQLLGEGGEAVAVIIFSSGSTGKPKGVMLTHGNLLALLRFVGREIVRPDDVIAGVPPYFHTFGCGLVLIGLDQGARMVAMQRFSGAADLLAAIRRHAATALYLVPPLLASLVQLPDDFCAARLPSLRTMVTGATALSAHVQAEALRLLPGVRALHAYGMSETSFGMVCAEASADKPCSCGLPLGEMQCKIIDPETGREVPQGSTGEICIRGPMVMKGYINNPKATRQIIDEGGWVHSGDLAYMDEDGCYFIVDRIKFIFKFNGHQVSPTELECFLNGHPAVQECGVLGVPHQYGEVPMALVVRAQGAEVTEEELQEFIKERVEPYKILRGGVRFVEALPKTPNGKLQRGDLPALLRASS